MLVAGEREAGIERRRDEIDEVLDVAGRDVAGGVLRADSGSDETFIGSEVDLLLNWQFDRHLSGYIGYSHFFAGDFIEQTGPSEDIDFVYAALMYTF